MGSPSECPDPSELEHYLLGYGDRSTVASIEGHLAFCARCTERAGGFASDDDFDRAVRRAGQPDDTPEPTSVKPLVRVLRQAIADSAPHGTVAWDGTVEDPSRRWHRVRSAPSKPPT